MAKMQTEYSGAVAAAENGRLPGTQLSDDEIVARVRRGAVDEFEILVRRYNQRLYRVARSILADDAEAEDVMQEAYVRAYLHLGQFDGRAAFATWLTKIAVHEALARARRRGRQVSLVDEVDADEGAMCMESADNVEQQVATRQLNTVLESAVGALSPALRTVFVLRDIEEMSTAAAAEVIGITEQNVKTRLHRARSELRRRITAQLRANVHEVFSFHLARCDRVVNRVLGRIHGLTQGAPIDAQKGALG